MIHKLLEEIIGGVAKKTEASVEAYIVKSSYQFIKQLIFKNQKPVIQAHTPAITRTRAQEERIFRATEAITIAICELQTYCYDFLSTAEVVDCAPMYSDDGKATRSKTWSAAYRKWSETEAVIKRASRALPKDTVEKVCAFHTHIFHLLHYRAKRASKTAVEHDKAFADGAKELESHFRTLNGMS